MIWFFKVLLGGKNLIQECNWFQVLPEIILKLLKEGGFAKRNLITLIHMSPSTNFALEFIILIRFKQIRWDKFVYNATYLKSL